MARRRESRAARPAAPARARHPAPRFRPRRDVPVLLVTTAATWLFTALEAPHWGITAQEWASRLSGASGDPGVVVVKITDQDYREFFGGRYPIDPERLGTLIDAVAAGRPRAIGVDVATDEPAYRALAAARRHVPVVWAADAAPCGGEGHGGGCTAEEVVPTPVLGGSLPGVLSGLAHLSPDHDGVFRRFRRSVGPADGRFPTFASALARSADAAVPGDDERAYLIPYHVPSLVIPAGDVLRLRDQAAFRDDGPLRGKVVLLGGDYAGRDRHRTPLGPAPGVEIWARVVAAELDGRPLPLPRPGWVAALAFLQGVLFIFLFHGRSFGRAVLMSGGLVLLLSALASLVAVHTLNLWLYFVPMLLLGLIAEVFERAKEIRNARVEQLIGGAGHGG
jgi:CHASE2 domain-containing sensor protein